MSSSGDVTRLLQRWGAGDPQAMEELLPLLYDELRRLAAALSLSPATVKREWATARAWLYRRLSDGGPAA